ncbi:MAG: class GN sortase [Neomegalonema sp.]|nr:class GN sortase [Neomegalonema sp.]
MNIVQKSALIAIMMAGAGLAGSALYIPGKALLGQQLLERAWERAKAGEPAKPWPWADIEPVAQIHFPRQDKRQLVLNEAHGEAMAWGPAHVTGTARLGAPGLTAVAAHRDTHFDFLGQVAPGDAVELETRDGLFITYRVTQAVVVNANQWRFPRQYRGQDQLVLSTCWPIGDLTPGPERLVIFTERVIETPSTRSGADLVAEIGAPG